VTRGSCTPSQRSCSILLTRRSEGNSSEKTPLKLRPGTAGGRSPRLPHPPEASTGGTAGAGEPTVPRDDQGSGDTCHVDVVDPHGNMVSATPCGGWLQSSPVIPGLGFPLGTRAQMFWLTQDLPNSLAGGKTAPYHLDPLAGVT
jgi:gamma-glutamyltranspeptidase / glutathione hydrolase